MTCAILARCATTGQLGVGVVSSLLAVTGRCAFVQAQVGAVVVQSMADPRLGPAALKLLAGGYRPEAVLRAFDRTEEGFEYRQVALVNAQGDTAVHSGSQAAGICGAAEAEGCAALCNRLVDRGVPDLMVETCERTKGELGDRLIAALRAAVADGGAGRCMQRACWSPSASPGRWSICASTGPRAIPWLSSTISGICGDHRCATIATARWTRRPPSSRRPAEPPAEIARQPASPKSSRPCRRPAGRGGAWASGA